MTPAPDAASPQDARREAVMAASFIIVARADNGIIGNGAEIPWRHRGDMMHFRNATLGCALIVGRTTFDTLPASMPGRDVVVVTSRPLPDGATALAAASFEEAIRIAVEDTGARAIAFAGGPRIYQAALDLPWLDHALVTEIEGRPEGTASMPEFGPGWSTVANDPLPRRDGEPHAVVNVLERRTGW
jgi:dihydrofolate reductase